jgi:hypothetical protein
MSGATSAWAAAAAGLETSGWESAAAFADAWSLVTGADVSGSAAAALTVVVALTTGAACAASATAAGACADLGGVVEAWAPDCVADARVFPLDGLDTAAFVGAEVFGLVVTDTDGAAVELVTFTVVGALGGTWFVDTGPTCAAAAGTLATASNKTSKQPISPLNERCIRQHLPRACEGKNWRARDTPLPVTPLAQDRCEAHKLRYARTDCA